MRPTFEGLDARTLRGYRILLDVDGTLVADGEEELTDTVRAQLVTLTRANGVYLHSNKGESDRLRAFAAAAGAYAIVDAPRKPSRQILRHVSNDHRPLIVIGDKWLTDGWFAWRVGAQFLRVARKRSYRETVPVRLTYAIDDVFAALHSALPSAWRR